MASIARRPEPTGRAVFALSLIGYLGAAVATILRGNLVMGDAVSRLANASYALDGRDPHLTAIGFVWNPLPTLAMIPPLALRGPWEWLAEPGYAASIASATSMAIATTALYRIAVRWGLGRGARLAVVASFALNPMILLYATNGMSEAFMLATLVPAAAALSAWAEEPRSTAPLARAGVLLGIAYLVRYESLAATAGAALFIAVLCAVDAPGPGWRARTAGTVAVVVVPTIVAFLVFAASSWLITGSATEQFTSAYGNTAVLASAGTHGGMAGIRFATSCLAVLAPAAGIALAAVVARGESTAIRRSLAVGAVLGPVLAAAALFQYSGSTLPFLRFFIVAVPLQLLLVMAALQGSDRPRRGLRTVVLVTVGVFSAITAGAGMLDPDVGVQEHHIASLVDPRRDRLDERAVLRAFQTEQEVAKWLDRQQLPDGSVLVDVLFGFPIVLASDRPDQFVIPSDRDWAQILADPGPRGVRLLLSVSDDGRGEHDALNRRFPGLYAGRAEGTDLRLEVRNDGGGPDWRIYEVLPAGPPPGGDPGGGP